MRWTVEAQRSSQQVWTTPTHTVLVQWVLWAYEMDCWSTALLTAGLDHPHTYTVLVQWVLWAYEMDCWSTALLTAGLDHPHGTTVGMWTSWDNDDCYSVVFELSHGKACLSLCIYVWFNVSDLKVVLVRGAVKQFSAWPSYVQNKIKIVFASDINKA